MNENRDDPDPSSPFGTWIPACAGMTTLILHRGSHAMTEVSTFRLYLLRATYLLILVGLGNLIWPGIIRHAMEGNPNHGAASSLLAAVTVLAALGIRYPLLDLAGRCCAPAVVCPSDRCGDLGVGQSLPDGNRLVSSRHSLALCSCQLREEAWRSVDASRPAGNGNQPVGRTAARIFPVENDRARPCSFAGSAHAPSGADM